MMNHAAKWYTVNSKGKRFWFGISGCVHVGEAIYYFRPQTSGHSPSMCTFTEPAEVWTSWRTITQQAMWQTKRSDAGAIWYRAKKGFVTVFFSPYECFLYMQSLVRIVLSCTCQNFEIPHSIICSPTNLWFIAPSVLKQMAMADWFIDSVI